MSDDPKLAPNDNHREEETLASPTELAGSTEGAINAEFAARDAVEAADAANNAGGDIDSEDSPPIDSE